MTWWLKKKETRHAMYKTISDFHFYFHLGHNVFNEFQNDYNEIDCVLEQLWAIREGLA